MTLLQINTSLFSNSGQSTRLAEQFVAGRRAADPDLDVVVRDLAREPVPHLTAERFHAFLAQPEARTLAQKTIVAESDALIDELKIADVIVIGLPMYNFGVPSQLKAYFDHVARAGVTFRYTEKGPLGLLTGKKAYVFATRGGLYAGTPRDSETSRWSDTSALPAARPTLRRASSSASAASRRSSPYQATARTRSSRTLPSASEIRSGKRSRSGLGQSRKLHTRASAPPRSVFTIRTLTSWKSPALTSASSTNPGVRNVEKAP